MLNLKLETFRISTQFHSSLNMTKTQEGSCGFVYIYFIQLQKMASGDNGESFPHAQKLVVMECALVKENVTLLLQSMEAIGVNTQPTTILIFLLKVNMK